MARTTAKKKIKAEDALHVTAPNPIKKAHKQKSKQPAKDGEKRTPQRIFLEDNLDDIQAVVNVFYGDLPLCRRTLNQALQYVAGVTFTELHDNDKKSWQGYVNRGSKVKVPDAHRETERRNALKKTQEKLLKHIAEETALHVATDENGDRIVPKAGETRTPQAIFLDEHLADFEAEVDELYGDLPLYRHRINRNYKRSAINCLAGDAFTELYQEDYKTWIIYDALSPKTDSQQKDFKQREKARRLNLQKSKKKFEQKIAEIRAEESRKIVTAFFTPSVAYLDFKEGSTVPYRIFQEQFSEIVHGIAEMLYPQMTDPKYSSIPRGNFLTVMAGRLYSLLKYPEHQRYEDIAEMRRLYQGKPERVKREWSRLASLQRDLSQLAKYISMIDNGLPIYAQRSESRKGPLTFYNESVLRELTAELQFEHPKADDIKMSHFLALAVYRNYDSLSSAERQPFIDQANQLCMILGQTLFVGESLKRYEGCCKSHLSELEDEKRHARRLEQNQKSRERRRQKGSAKKKESRIVGARPRDDPPPAQGWQRLLHRLLHALRSSRLPQEDQEARRERVRCQRIATAGTQEPHTRDGLADSRDGMRLLTAPTMTHAHKEEESKRFGIYSLLLGSVLWPLQKDFSCFVKPSLMFEGMEYVGRGTRSRPFKHTILAYFAWTYLSSITDPIQRASTWNAIDPLHQKIITQWRLNRPVIAVHSGFKHSYEDSESWEYCVIRLVGKINLANSISGHNVYCLSDVQADIEGIAKFEVLRDSVNNGALQRRWTFSMDAVRTYLGTRHGQAMAVALMKERARHKKKRRAKLSDYNRSYIR